MRDSNVIKGALIFAIILIVIEGVFLYIYHDSSKKMDSERKTASEAAKKFESDLKASQGDVLKLTTLITGEESYLPIGEIEKSYMEDKNSYFRDEGISGYRASLPFMAKITNEKNRALAKAEAEKRDSEADFKRKNDEERALTETAKKEKDEVEKRAAEKVNAYNENIETIRTDFGKVKQEFTRNTTYLHTDLVNAEAKVKQKVSEAQENLDWAKGQSDRLSELTRITFDRPLGAIDSVDQRSKTVIINLGSADLLQTRMMFTVYPPSITGISFLPRQSENAAHICEVCKRERSLNASKASIEVTEIIGPHKAKARILDDILTNPVVAGDVVYTPIWKPGEGQRFALGAGMKLEGIGSRDGTHHQSDLELIKSLIRINGGIVDAWILEEGEDDENGPQRGDLQGKISSLTNFLVIGDLNTDDDRDKDLMQTQRQMQQTAKRFGNVREIGLRELLTRMGWKNVTPVSGYGEFAVPSDYRVLPRGDTPSSPGTVAPLFTPDNEDALVINKDRKVPSSPGTVSEAYGTGRTPASSPGTVNELFRTRQPGASSSGVK